jgi:hypothetical protein
MSHPPETNLTSRVLAIRLIQMPVDAVDRGEQLIDAWVRVREIEAKLSSVRWFLDQTSVDSRGEAQMIAYPEIAKLESALATARKQLGEKVP